MSLQSDSQLYISLYADIYHIFYVIYLIILSFYEIESLPFSKKGIYVLFGDADVFVDFV